MRRALAALALVAVSARGDQASDRTILTYLNKAMAWYRQQQTHVALASDPAALNKALNASERAVKDMPGEPRYRLNLAVVLLRMGKFEDSRAITQGIVKSADRLLASQAEQFLTQIDRAEQFHARNERAAGDLGPAEIGQRVPGTETAVIDRPAPVMKRRADGQSDSPADAPRDPAAATAPTEGTPVTATPAHPYSMIGTIAAVSCQDAPQMQFTLQGAGIVMHLHATDLSKIEVKSEAGKSAAAKLSCLQFAGKKARVSYQLASQKPWDGEIVSVAFQNAP